MTERSKHLFRFKASEIAAAATREAEYHEERAEYWRSELDDATDRVMETASIKLEKQAITGGYHPTVVVDYGDPAAYQRMQEAFRKEHSHKEEAEEFRSDSIVYGTQGDREYELDIDDVHYYRLSLPARVNA